MSKTTTTNQDVIILHDGKSVSEVFYECIRSQVEFNLHTLVPGERYALKQICGPGFWDLLTNGEARRAGVCMVHMVENGLFPTLVVAESKHEYPVYYQLI